MNSRYLYVTVYISRFVYGLNWFSTSTTLPYISDSLHLDPLEAGFIGTAFYLGLIPFQIIGGSLESIFGARKTAIFGLIIMGLFSILSACSSSFIQISIFRFMTGSGAAMFSSPALALLEGIKINKRRTSMTGLYNASFGVGSGIGILLGIVFSSRSGWENLLIIDGSLGIGLALIMYITSIKVANVPQFTDKLPVKAKRFFSSRIYFISISAAISTIAEAVIGQEFVYYSSIQYSLKTVYAAIIVASFMLTGLAGGTLMIRNIHRSLHQIRYYSILILVEIFLFFLMPFAFSFVSALVLISIMGILTSACLSITYSLVIESVKGSDPSLYLGLNNFLQKIISFSTPALFIFIGTIYSFQLSWYILGITGFILFLIYIVKGRNEFSLSMHSA